MKKVIMIFICVFCVLSNTTTNIYADPKITIIHNIDEFYQFLYRPSTDSIRLENDITIRESAILKNNKIKVDMNGYSFIIPEGAAFCLRSNEKNSSWTFIASQNTPVFKVDGILELYTGNLISNGTGTLIDIGKTGRLYTKNTIIDTNYYNTTLDSDNGIHSIYDNQVVQLNIPYGTAIHGGQETNYYHLNIKAKTVIQSSVQPTFSYCSIESSQDVLTKQGVYNGVNSIDSISIWKHQLVQSIDSSMEIENLQNILPNKILTKDNQQVSVYFDASQYDPTIDEQILVGEYRNINALYQDALPELTLKLVKDQVVPISDFTLSLSGTNCRSELPIDNNSRVTLLIDVNYIVTTDAYIEYAKNIDFINFKTMNIDFWEGQYNLLSQDSYLAINKNDCYYFRLVVNDGYQKGYSNVIKIENFITYYISEPKSEWLVDNALPSIPPPNLGGSQDKPDDLLGGGSDHRNDTSIDEDKDDNQVDIKEDEINANIKAKEDIVVDLKNHQVTIPHEIAKRYKSHTIHVIEKDDEVKITVDNKEVMDESIQVKDKEQKNQSYLGYIIVATLAVISIFGFLFYQRRRLRHD